MFNIFFIGALLNGCMSNKHMLKDAREELNGFNCLERLETKLLESKCHSIRSYRGPNSIIFRCHKADIKRENLWDTWWFRLTSSLNKFDPKKLPIVDKHTICLDSQIRIEAYPPEEEGKQ